MQRIVFHVDFDYFYAQCEEIRNHELQTKPVCVCVYSGRDQDSGAIATANYRAREFGAKSGMSIRDAKFRLRERSDAVFLPTDIGYYTSVSEDAMKIMQHHADIFEYVGRDEAYLDMSKRTEKNYDRAAHIAQQIKNAIREKTMITCSIGVSSNKIVAKIASDFSKPDGLTVVPSDKISAFLEPLRVRDIPGIGRKAEQTLKENGVETVGQLRKMTAFDLDRMFGRKTAQYMYSAARGQNDAPVTKRKPIMQFSRIVTLTEDSKDFDFLHHTMMRICSELLDAIRKNGRLFRSVEVQFVNSDMTGKSKSKSLKNATLSSDELEKTATALLSEALKGQEKNLRRLGVKVADLSEVSGQSSLDGYF